MSAKTAGYRRRLSSFLIERIFPAEADYDRFRQQAGPNDRTMPPIIAELKAAAKKRGLWNLSRPAESGLTQLEHAPLAELTGWSVELAPEVLNRSAPDSGIMAVLHQHDGRAARSLVAQVKAAPVQAVT